MMNDYLIATDNSAAYLPGDYRGIVKAGIVNGFDVLNILHPTDPTKSGDSLIGGWDREGNLVAPFDRTLYEAIRPLGNERSHQLYDESTGQVIGTTRGGEAVITLRYSYFSGFARRKIGETGELYPVDNNPITIAIKHKQFGVDQWGWRAEIVGDAATRDPSVRAIGVYSDPECTQYLYTTGAFVRGPTEWQSGGGDVWYTEAPAGQYKPAREDYHLALLYAAKQEGYQTLFADSDGVIFEHWEETQPEPGLPGDEWVDTGATVTGFAGQMYYISDPAVVAGLIPGQEIRLGEDAEGETTFVAIWAGTDNLIQIDPYVSANIGDKLHRK